jgi:hypothetical protein
VNYKLSVSCSPWKVVNMNQHSDVRSGVTQGGIKLG